MVEPSNLNRQQYYVKHIGMKKVHAIKEILKEVNPFVNIEAIDKKIEKEKQQGKLDELDRALKIYEE